MGKGCCIKPGRLTNNGYLNFLREFRRRNCHLTGQQAVQIGAKRWHCLPQAEKNKYIKMACGRKMTPRKTGCSGRRMRRGTGKRKPPRKYRRQCKRPKGKCTRIGPVTPNAYLNFLRAFRRCNCNLTNSQIIRLGARKWCALPACMKDHFKRQACKVAKSCRVRTRAVCKK